jgi:hypothetical protein
VNGAVVVEGQERKQGARPKIYSTKDGAHGRALSGCVVSFPSNVEMSEIGGAKLIRQASTVEGVNHYRVDEAKDGPLPAVWRKAVLVPQAAGDVTVSLVGFPADGELGTDETTYVTTTYALGTGALILEDNTVFSDTTGEKVVRLQVVPTGVESRLLDTSPASRLGLTRVINQTFN